MAAFRKHPKQVGTRFRENRKGWNVFERVKMCSGDGSRSERADFGKFEKLID